MLSLALSCTVALQPAPDTIRRFSFGPDEIVAATIFGSGPSTVVIIPGLLGSSFGFRNVTPALVEAGHRVVVVDLLGTGCSSRPPKADYSLTAQMQRVAGVLDSLEVKDAVVLAQAIGGSVSYRLALHRPDLVRGIVGIDAGPSEQAATSGMRNALTFAPVIKLFGAKRIMVGKVRGGLRDSSADPDWVTDDVVEAYTAPYREDAKAMLRVLNAMAKSQEPEQLTPNLRSICAPVTLLLGDTPRDKMLTPESVDRLRSGLPNFELEIVPGVGKYVHEENPGVVIAAVLRLSNRRGPILADTGYPRSAADLAVPLAPRAPARTTCTGLSVAR
ncbi:MAG TPA: alpha/beta hydrolase [Longimicrobiales bacterium]|nr:alpha/beta hydrolase [Longimicrobiales bacterium]